MKAVVDSEVIDPIDLEVERLRWSPDHRPHTSIADGLPGGGRCRRAIVEVQVKGRLALQHPAGIIGEDHENVGLGSPRVRVRGV